jgi:hypothetical protein
MERLGEWEFGSMIADGRAAGDSERFLSEVGTALGAAAPFVESFEFVPLAPPPPALAGDPTMPVAPAAPAEPASTEPVESLESVGSVVISLGRLAERAKDLEGASEEWLSSEERLELVTELELDSAAVGRQIALRLEDLDMAQLIEEAEQLRREAAERAAESRVEENGAHRLEHERRVLMVEPMPVDESTIGWQRNLLEDDEVERLKARERESMRILGREFDSSIRREGRPVGRLRAQVSAKKLLQQVLYQARRDKGEIPFAVDGEGQVYVAREEDRERLWSTGHLAVW